MHRKNFCALAVSLIGYFALCPAAFPHANIESIDTPSTDIAEKFARQGIIYYKQRDPKQALDHFSRALLLDPENRTARTNLPQINNWADMPGRQRIELYLAEDLLAFIDQTRRKSVALTEARDRLVEILLIRHAHADDLIRRGLAEIEKRFNFPEKNWPLHNDSKNPLEALHAALIIEKERLSYNLTCRQKQYLWLQKVQEQMEQQRVLPITDEHKPNIAVGTMPSAAQTVPGDQINFPFADPWEEIADLRDELTGVKKQLDNLHNDMELRNQRIIDLTKEIIEFSLKLAEKELTLSEKVNTLNSLHEAYANLQSRLALGQRIIEEKNTQIQSLEESLASLQGETVAREKQVNAILTSRDKTLDEWESILVIYQGKLKEATRKLEASNDDIAGLHEELTTTRAQLFEKESALEKVKTRLAVLQTQLQPVQDQSTRH